MNVPALPTTRRSLMQGWSAWVAVGMEVVIIAAYTATGTLFGTYPPVAPFAFGVGVICLLLVVGDCRRTRMNGLWWPLLVLVTGVYGLWFYLLVRNKKGRRD